MEFLLNMLENDDSKLQTKFGVHIASNTFKNNPILKSQDCTTPPPHLTTLNAYPTPRESGGSNVFAKMKGQDELKGTGAI